MKIAILGTASSWSEAPFGTDWQIWSLIGNYSKIQDKSTVHRWFELHPFDYLRRECGAVPEFFETIKSLGDKATTFQKESLAPDATLLRKDELLNVFGHYFTASVAWIVGEALLLNPEKIGLWGVHCGGNNEYANQRACIEGYLRFAQGMKIATYVHPKSSLFKAPLYCTDDWLRLHKGIKNADSKCQENRDNANYWKGYQEALEHFKGGMGEN